MPTIDLKNEVLSYVDKADVRLLKMIKALAESYQEAEENYFEEIPAWQKEILDERLLDHEANPARGRDWVDVKADLIKKYGF